MPLPEYIVRNVVEEMAFTAALVAEDANLLCEGALLRGMCQRGY